MSVTDSSYFLPPCVFSAADGELLIYAAAETESDATFYGVEDGEAIARFRITDDQTLVFDWAAVPVFADPGARYVCAPDDEDA